MRIVLFGPPGVGKGTQAQLLRERHGLKHISTGDILRAHVRNGTPIGLKIKEYIERGAFAPDEVICPMVEEAIAEAGFNRFILDGFPRTVEQAEWLHDLLMQHKAPLHAVISLRVPVQIIVDRLSQRRIHKVTGESYHLETKPPPTDIDPELIVQRQDDQPEVIRARMDKYRNETRPVINYYRGTGVYYEVDGVGDFEEVFARINAVLDQTMAAASEPEVVAVAIKPSEHVGRLRSMIDDALVQLVPEQSPAELYEPVRYALAGEGKRFRPILLLLSAEAFRVPADRALPAALAVEVFHTFTLVHDDIMDHSDERRRRPTVHVRWDQSTAILSGDYLMALSYDLLARLETKSLHAIMHTFFEMVAKLCEGQALDKAYECRSDVSLDEYLHMVDCKTGALLRASLELGAILGGASTEQRTMMRELGNHLGRAFQIQDDLLDLVAEDERWGKPIGNDLMEGKKTFLTLSALHHGEATDRRWFAESLGSAEWSPSMIAQARNRMEASGVIERARNAVLHHTGAALEYVKGIPSSEAAETMRWLLKKMQERLH
jgi:geranylgeranyl diphosphate synthase, type II